MGMLEMIRMMMCRSALPICLVFLGMSLFFAHISALTQSQISKLDEMLGNVRDCRKIQGLAVSVIAGGEPVLVKGYGWAGEAEGRPVSEQTAFYIGSITKSFAATVAALLMDEGKINITWDTPVREILGESFYFSDPLRTEQTSLKDLFCHRTGVPGYDDTLSTGFSTGTSRVEVANRIRYMCPSETFRSSYLYNNFMVGLAGYVTEVAAGSTWEKLTQSYILDRLNMDQTGFISVRPQPEDVALPYSARGSTIYPVDPVLVQLVMPIDPAGTIYSTATDMTKYLQYQLANVRNNSASNLTDTFGRWNPLPRERSKFRPLYDEAFIDIAYGLGWKEASYRGYQMFWHGGLISTYISRIFLIPSINSGFFLSKSGSDILQNGTHDLVEHILDVLLDMPPVKTQQQLCAQRRSGPPSFTVPTTETGPSGNNLRQKLKPYMGTFRHPAFNDITIYLNGSDQHLHMLFGRFGHARLQINPNISHGFDCEWLDPVRGLFWYMPTPHFQIVFGSEFEHGRAKVLRIDLGGPDYTDFVRNLNIAELDTYICGSNTIHCVSNVFITFDLVTIALINLRS